jgi:peptide/nickel transport system ATP-binding protein
LVKAVNGVSYSIDAGRTLGVVGESGSGKSVSALSILRLLDGNGYIADGKIMFRDMDLAKAPIRELQKIRGNAISMVFQEPMTSLNPVFTVKRQLGEVFRVHQGMSKKEAYQETIKILIDVKIPEPETSSPAVCASVS